ncbi:MAG: hypothetical protein ACOYVD_11540 [Bacillota bacterium]
MNLRDRLTRGFLAGIFGGIPMNIFDLISFYLGISELRFIDWAAIMIYGVKPGNIPETVFALLAQIIFSGVLGIIFAYLITLVNSVNYLLKGAIFGSFTWFLLYGISLLFKVEATIPLHLDTAASDFLGSIIYGLVLAKTLYWFSVKLN